MKKIYLAIAEQESLGIKNVLEKKSRIVMYPTSNRRKKY